MGRAPIDLFDDPPWPATAPSHETPVRSPRSSLVASLAFVDVLLASQALPWFTSPVTSAWTPLSRWVNGGWSPGTQYWGLLVLVLGVLTVLGIVCGLLWPRRGWLVVLLMLATALVVVTLLEATAQPPAELGLDVHAVYGAWIGSAAAVLAWCGIAVATCLGRKAT
jgi:hypothetical protein